MINRQEITESVSLSGMTLMNREIFIITKNVDRWKN
jgi:hypothetical protein